MSEFKQAQLLAIRCDLEALISERFGMIAENFQRSHQNQAVSYLEDAFQKNADAMRAIAPNFHDFS